MRVNVRLAITVRQPTQVRWGTCLTRFCVFLLTYPSHALDELEGPLIIIAAALMLLADNGDVTIGIILHLDVAATLLTL